MADHGTTGPREPDWPGGAEAGGWHWGYFIQYTDTTLENIVDYDFGSNTRSNTNQYSQYKTG